MLSDVNLPDQTVFRSRAIETRTACAVVIICELELTKLQTAKIQAPVVMVLLRFRPVHFRPSILNLHSYIF